MRKQRVLAVKGLAGLWYNKGRGKGGGVILLRAFKYRVYPTKPQIGELECILWLCRELYNAALEERILAYKMCGKHVNYYEQQSALLEVKEVRPEYKRLHSQVLQGVLKRLDRAFKAFFSRVKRGAGAAGFPRFQGRERFDSFTFPQAASTGVKILTDSRLRVHGLSGSLKVRWHRPLTGSLKTCTIKREGMQWFVVFTCVVSAVPLPHTGNSVGIDLGLNHFLVTSDGEFVDNPRYHRAAQQKLRVAQRSVARKRSGSKRQRKGRKRVARVHRKVKNQRTDFHHRKALGLLRGADNIAVENLNIKGLARTRLAKSVADVGWGNFVGILHAKAEYAGRTVYAVSPNYTSQDCSTCGYRERHALSVREFTCNGCGAYHQRDVNAAKNILAKAVQQQWGRCDPSVANVTVSNVCVG